MKLTWKVEAGQFTDLAFDPTGQSLLAIQNHADVPVEVRPNWQTPQVKYDILPHCGIVLRCADTLMQLGSPHGPAHGEFWLIPPG